MTGPDYDLSAAGLFETQLLAACLLEGTARKPGNVHPQASFDDLSYSDLTCSARAVAPVLAKAGQIGVGRTILEAIQKTHAVAQGNTNLGIVLLLTPLAAVPTEKSLPAGIGVVLDALTQKDAALAYEAIRLANPGGMQKVDAEDVSDSPSGTLLEVMQLAAGRDTVARQYATRFELVLGEGVSGLADAGSFADCWEEAIIRLHLMLMARCPDTLIARKRGAAEARQSAALAAEVLTAGWPGTRSGREKLVQLDGWLRAVGHARNPGTTADLVAASLFAALRDGHIETLPIERIVAP